MNAVDSLDLMLPKPKRMEGRSGVFALDRPIQIEANDCDDRIRRALETWVDTTGQGNRTHGPTTVGGGSTAGAVIVARRDRIDAGRTGAHHEAQGYHLEVAPDRIILAARTPEGCWHAVQTLRRLSPDGRDVARAIPCCIIKDRPDFETRGVLLDITRGRVPTLARLKSLVDRLALLKINQLQLYIEHAFVFAFDPDICDEQSGLTAEEVREFDAYCRDQFIDLVPAVATFGHMGRILSMPRYRHLAEVAPDRPWFELDWPARARGFTLDCTNPESHRLVERIWSDVLEAFSSPVVNICGDEPWDLGRGKNADKWNDRQRGEAYVDHIRRTHELCASRGRRTMFWSDVVTTYPELFDRVPRDSIVLHWGYDDRADYAGTRRFVESGLTTFVCPGTSGWKRVVNAIDLAERNIKTFACEGRRCGARGLIVTDWGDHGHFNMPTCSWHGLALGAVLGWSAGHPTGSAFDEAFARTEWGLADGEVVRALREASAFGAECETWPILWKSVERLNAEIELPTVDAVESFDEAAVCTSKLIRSARRVCPSQPHALSELELAGQFNELCARKLRLMHGLRDGALRSDMSEREVRQWADEVKTYAGRFAELWRAGHKESGLADILAALDAAAVDVARAVTA